MLMALTDLDCSSRYHQSILKEYNHRKPIVFLSGSRLSSGCIFHTHHYLQPSQIRTFFRILPDTGLARLPQCQSGIWQNAGKTIWRVGGTFTVWPGQTQILGRFKLCLNTYRIDGREMALTQLIPTDAPDADGNMNWQAYNGTQYPSYYMGIHCFI
ncbi:hypothetical protein HMI78_004928 [Salmonella enterica]|nr:hypothetical protein [Salmonella enterica]